MKVIAYVDGFNLYHGLKAKKWNYYYWLNLETLINRYLVEGQKLVQIKYFTSLIKEPEDKHLRQKAYLDALRTIRHLKIYKGFFLEDTIVCKDCNHSYVTYHEKKTDVNMAVELLSDAIDRSMDVALIITADSDLVPAVVMAHKYNPELLINFLFPTGRTSKALVKVANNHEWINRNRLSKSQFPDKIRNRYGVEITKPEEWKPPGGKTPPQPSVEA